MPLPVTVSVTLGSRLFITGVSPVTVDDVTSGFNIGTNISLEPDFNEIELKYLPRSDPADQTAAGEAAAPLERYLRGERLARQLPGVRFIGLVVVFHGWEMAFCDAVHGES